MKLKPVYTIFFILCSAEGFRGLKLEPGKTPNWKLDGYTSVRITPQCWRCTEGTLWQGGTRSGISNTWSLGSLTSKTYIKPPLMLLILVRGSIHKKLYFSNAVKLKVSCGQKGRPNKRMFIQTQLLVFVTSCLWNTWKKITINLG